jgi:hypothetical protein
MSMPGADTGMGKLLLAAIDRKAPPSSLAILIIAARTACEELYEAGSSLGTAGFICLAGLL